MTRHTLNSYRQVTILVDFPRRFHGWPQLQLEFTQATVYGENERNLLTTAIKPAFL